MAQSGLGLFFRSQNILSKMKTCPSCKLEKSEDAFHKHKLRGLQLYCKECRKVVDQKYWEKRKNDPEKMRMKKSWRTKTNKENQEFVFNYLIEHPCPCGETNPMVLTFDHLHDKTTEVSLMIVNTRKLVDIKKEIEKCQVLCSNCHMKKTAKDFNWWVYRLCKKQGIA